MKHCLAATLLLGPLALVPVAGTTQEAALLDAEDRALRSDIEWLADRHLLSVPLTTWPLPVATLTTALERIREQRLEGADRHALARIEAALARLDDPATLRAGVNSARHVALDGETAPLARTEADATLQQAGDRVAGRLRLGVDDDPLARRMGRVGLDGSYASTLWRGVSISYGLLDRWWGPGRMTSPILSDAGPPIPMLTLRRAADSAPGWSWLEWLGPWGGELSFGQLQHYTPSQARTLGLRLYVRPLDGLELGASRFITWAGAGQPGGWSAIRDALRGRSNIPPGVDEPDPSNELAGFDLRYARPHGFGGSYAIYAHVIGEDEANRLPFKRFGTAGLQFKHRHGADRHEWTLETTDTMTDRSFGGGNPQRSAYTHSTYVDGHYHRGLPIGAHIGGAGRTVSLGWAWVPTDVGWLERVTVTGVRGRVAQRSAQDVNAVFSEPARLHAVQARVQGRHGERRWSLGLSWQEAGANVGREVGLLAGVELPVRLLD